MKPRPLAYTFPYFRFRVSYTTLPDVDERWSGIIRSATKLNNFVLRCRGDLSYSKFLAHRGNRISIALQLLRAASGFVNASVDCDCVRHEFVEWQI